MANQYDISIILKVLDKATGPLRKIGRSIGNVSRPLRTMTTSFKTAGTGVDRLSARLRMLDSRMAKTGRSIERSGFTKMGKRLSAVGRDIALKVTLPIALMGGAAIKMAMNSQSAFTGVRKTVDATEVQYAALKKEILDLALKVPVATNKLFALAETAGQLDVKRKNIPLFVKTMADLGAAAPILDMQLAATQIAQFANVTKMSQQDFDNFASALVYLGNNTATTEDRILNMTQRLAGAGSIIGLAQPEILGLAAGLAQLGIKAESGGTAFSQIMRKIDKEIGTGSQKMLGFATVAGMPVKVFEEQWKTDAVGALIKVTEGLGRLDKEGKNVNIILDKLGLDGMRIADALLRAAGSGDMFRQTIEKSSKAYKENIALTEEAAKRNKDVASQLIMFSNRVKQLAVSFGNILLPVLIGIINFLKPIVDWFTKLNPAIKAVIMVVGFLAAALGPLLMVFGFLASAIGSLTAIGGLGTLLGLMVSFAAPALAFAAAFTAVAMAIKAVYDNWQFLKQEAKYLKEFLGSGFKSAGENMSGGLGMGGFGPDTGESVNTINTQKSETEVKIRVAAEQGSSAVVEKVKSKGATKAMIATEAYLGGYP